MAESDTDGYRFITKGKFSKPALIFLTLKHISRLLD